MTICRQHVVRVESHCMVRPLWYRFVSAEVNRYNQYVQLQQVHCVTHYANERETVRKHVFTLQWLCMQKA